MVRGLELAYFVEGRSTYVGSKVVLARPDGTSAQGTVECHDEAGWSTVRFGRNGRLRTVLPDRDALLLAHYAHKRLGEWHRNDNRLEVVDVPEVDMPRERPVFASSGAHPPRVFAR